jgi:hypothetical protein
MCTSTDTATGQAWVPAACTLPTVEQPVRVAEFDDLFNSAAMAVERPAPTRLVLVLGGAAEATARDLAARENACCSFFAFTFVRAETGRLRMQVEVPATQVQVLDALAARAATAVGLPTGAAV